MHRCFLLLIMISCTAAMTSCTGCYSAAAGDPENCNMNPTVAHEWISPDGKAKAVENRFDCPGWYALNIDVIAADGRTKTTAFTDRPAAQTRPNVWPELKLEWKSDSDLWITYPAAQDTTCVASPAGLKVHCIDATVSKP